MAQFLRRKFADFAIKIWEPKMAPIAASNRRCHAPVRAAPPLDLLDSKPLRKIGLVKKELSCISHYPSCGRAVFAPLDYPWSMDDSSKSCLDDLLIFAPMLRGDLTVRLHYRANLNSLNHSSLVDLTDNTIFRESISRYLPAGHENALTVSSFCTASSYTFLVSIVP